MNSPQRHPPDFKYAVKQPEGEPSTVSTVVTFLEEEDLREIYF